jgi:hypothetical protein
MYNPSNEDLMNRTDLHLLPTPPKLGRFHQPYAFGDYVDHVTKALNDMGVTVAQEEYAVSKDNMKMFGSMEIRPMEGELIKATDWKLLVGIRGSHDQSIARGLVLGSQVMVCSNLCFHGNLGHLRTKQTTNIEGRIRTLIRQSVHHIPAMAERQDAVFDMYKEKRLSMYRAEAALVEMFRRGGLSGNQLAVAVSEWDKPTYEEHAENKGSAWQLFNAATQALKPTGQNVNMNLVSQRSEIVSNVVNEFVGIAEAA